LALSLALSFYQHQRIQNYLAFQRKDFLLIAGILFILIGLSGVRLAPIYSVIISITIYAGIKIFIGRRKKMIEKEVGEGICVKCGSKIENQKCPICDRKKS
jgi:predicted membrane protein